ncbi:MAG: Amuc_1100 family pilus-like protein [Akkermansiaceae bacterium]|jgi:hypothetical protein|nr:Amuc_1100 family pilus-like protein [Akkermansiaceae bacterium]
MSWIQENKFVAALGAASLAGAIIIGYFGFSARGKYSRALDDFQTATGQIDEFKALPLFPEDDLIVSKRKNLNEYRDRIIALQKSFDKFRPKEQPAVSPQEFQDQAKSANEEVVKACAESKTALPEGFFLGFEGYNAALPRGEATAVLTYQLGAIKELLLAASKNGVSQVVNLHRPKTVEEDGGKWEPAKTDTARAFPLELTMKGTPRALRQVFSGMLTSENYFFTVRTLRLTNEKHGTPPTKTDARFDPVPGTAPGGAPGGVRPPPDPFGGFVLPSDEPEPKPEDKPAPKPAPAPGAPTTFVPLTPGSLPVSAQAPVAPPAAPAASGDILKQVLGNEEVQVFLRIDILSFLPAVKLAEVPN